VVLAQVPGGRTVPSATYFSGFPVFYDGEYRNSLRWFQEAGQGGIKTSQTRWIDSICYYAMVGESYYQLGQVSEALEQYAASLRLYVRFYDWLNQVQFPNNIPTAGPLSAVVFPWGKSGLNAVATDFPHTMHVHQGQLNVNPDIISGGAFQARVMYPINAQEIVRCTSLALRRRAQILGPLGEHDELTKDVLTALGTRPFPPNHWSRAWVWHTPARERQPKRPRPSKTEYCWLGS
jgi:hypothetical protein